MKKILPLFSYVFHPILIPAMATILYLLYHNDDFIIREKLFVLMQIGIVTFVIPVLLFVLLRSIGNVDTIMMTKISERKIPLVVHCFLIILLLKKSITIDRYPELHFFLLGGMFSIMLAMILLFGYFKASLHMIGISSLTVFIIGMSLHLEISSIFSVAILILLNGIIASSRIEMKAHTIVELVVGFFLGAIPQLLLLVLWL